jgi:hypothetical protein
MNAIVFSLVALFMAIGGKSNTWPIKTYGALFELHLIVIRSGPTTTVAEASARSIRSLAFKSVDSVSTSRQQEIAAKIGRILASPNQSDQVKLPLCWAISQFGRNGNQATKGLKSYLAEVKTRPLPRGPNKMEAAQGQTLRIEEFLEALIRKLESDAFAGAGVLSHDVTAGSTPTTCQWPVIHTHYLVFPGETRMHLSHRFLCPHPRRGWD